MVADVLCVGPRQYYVKRYKLCASVLYPCANNVFACIVGNFVPCTRLQIVDNNGLLDNRYPTDVSPC